jgi:hypothetical protein
MKSRVYYLIFSIFVIILMSVPVVAQSPQNRGEAPIGRRARISPEQKARAKVDTLTAELNLTEKQSKEVYKLYLQQANQMVADLTASFSGEGRMRPEGVPQGGIGRGNMQRPPAGAERGNMRQSGERPNMQQGERRQSGGEAIRMPPESEEHIAKRDKKMKKILSLDQYEKWSVIERRDIIRAKENEMRENMPLSDYR